MSEPRSEAKSLNQVERRGFIKKVLAGVLGTLAGLVPAGIALNAFCDPLRRKSKVDNTVRVASLDILPGDGVPRKFTVVASMQDAWNKFPQTPIGAVYLRRTGEKKVEAFNVVCPHAGCFVDYSPARTEYYCPCHRSSFALDGRVKNPSSPSPRGMDSLEVEIRNGHEIWVKFQNFVSGHAEKIPVV